MMRKLADGGFALTNSGVVMDAGVGAVTMTSGSAGVDVLSKLASVRRERAPSVSYAGNRK